MPRILPTEEQLRTWYLEQDWTVNAISKHTGYPFYKIKEWLLTYGMWDQDRADRNKAKLTSKTQRQPTAVDGSQDEAGEARASEASALQLPAVDTRNQIGPVAEFEQDDSAWSRLNARQKQTALTFVRAMTQPVRPTYQSIAAEAGIAIDTLNQDMRDVDFQEVTTELMNRDARYLVNTLMKQDLIKLLEAGKVNTRDRETILKYLGELSPDTMIQIANVLPHRSNDPKLPY